MLLYLINPVNPLVSVNKVKQTYWNRYRVWKPLSLLIIAGLTPPEWDIRIIDENLGIPDYASLPSPDMVGITAFSSQAERAYDLAAEYRNRGVTVVMGGIHATMCSDEALERVDAIVMGEAESIWAQVLEDTKKGKLNRIYKGKRLGMDKMPLARHDLLPSGYKFGLIQTTRGCPLNCNFCSVSSFNGRRYRYRPIENILEELKLIKERHVLIVDDNFIGTRKEHICRTKDLLRAMIKAKIDKKWITQVTINFADDQELLRLAAKAGCTGVFIGFESINVEGLTEINKSFNFQKGRDFKSSVHRIKQHGILVAGSFIMGLDVDKPGIGQQIASTANYYNIDILNVLFLTPLPGTKLWEKMKSDGRIAANDFPEDWKYYTLTCPVAKYNHLSWADIINENEICSRSFYSYSCIFYRVFQNMLHNCKPFITLASNLSYRSNAVRFYHKKYRGLDLSKGGNIDQQIPVIEKV
ncbi:MAG: radical SAM protein [Spirochaetota bacterium]|nr:radical SAM protein [Spirochaetota bacterium]